MLSSNRSDLNQIPQHLYKRKQNAVTTFSLLYSVVMVIISIR